MSVFRSILAIVAGFAFVLIMSTLTDSILEGVGFFPPPEQQLKTWMTWWLLLIALGYRIVYTIAGGWITSLLAPRLPILHAVILGAIGTMAALTGTIVMWKLGSQWYSILLTVTALPCTWVGGRLARRQS